VYRHSSSVLILLGLATVALMWPMIGAQPTALASQTPVTPVTEAQELIDSRFEPLEFDVLFVIEATEGDILRPSALADLHNAIEAVRASPELARYLVPVEVPELGLEDLGLVSIADAVDALLRRSGEPGGLDGASDDAVRESVATLLEASDPETWGLASQSTNVDGVWTSPAMFVEFAADNAALGGGGRVVTVGTNSTEREQFARDLESTLREESEAFEAWSIAADVNLTAEDQGTAAGPYIAATVFAVLLVLGLSFRSYWPVAVAGLALGALMVWIKGGANAIGFKEDQILSTILPIAMISFGIDSTFHALGRIREAPHHGSSKRAFAIGLTGVSAALALAASTDGAAFLANSTSSIEALRQFGVGAALSTVAAFALLGVATPLIVSLVEDLTGRATLTSSPRRDLLPSLGAAGGATAVVMVMVFLAPGTGAAMLVGYGFLAVLLPAWRGRTDGPSAVDQTHHGSSSDHLGALVGRVASYPRTTLSVIAVVTAIAGWSALGLSTNFEVSEFFDPESDFLVGIDKAQAYIGTQAGEPITVLVEGPLAEEAALNDIEAFVADVGRVDDGSLARNPDGSIKVSIPLLDLAIGVRGDLRREYVSALEVGTASQAPWQVAEYLWSDPGSERFSTILSFEIPDTRQRASVHEIRLELDPLVADLALDLQDLDPESFAILAGSPILRDDQLAGIADSLWSTLPVAALACFILAAAFMRSVRFGLVTIAPIALVVVWLFGFMAATDRSINAVTAIAGAVSIGIGIDYATHLTIRYLEEHRNTGDVLQALEIAGAGTGAALAGSAGTSVAGFAILALAPMPLFASYGLLTVAMILMALVASLFVLPSLLVLTSRTAPDLVAMPIDRPVSETEIQPELSAPAASRFDTDALPLFVPPARPEISIEIGRDGAWVEAVAEIDGRTHRSRGAPSQEGIIEAMVAAVTADNPEPPPFPVAVTKAPSDTGDLLVVVLEHPGGTLTSGVAPLIGPMTEILENAVLSALGWPARRP
jgi:predicted RND superfamily exporter protein